MVIRSSDIWAYGRILAKIAIGCPFFISEDNLSQFVESTRMLGSITNTDVDLMPTGPGTQFSNFNFPVSSLKVAN